VTYPFLRFLEQTVRPEWRVFEYGCGSSTSWWSRRVAKVVAVEHDPMWAEQAMQLSAAGRAHVICCPEGGAEEPGGAADVAAFFESGFRPVLTNDEGHNQRSGLIWDSYRGYASAIGRYPKGYFDVVVVDGMARAVAAWMAARWVRRSGLIVFDNSDRQTYAPGYQILAQAGFQRIDFWGPGPVNTYEWCTSVFISSLDALLPPVRPHTGQTDVTM
jgi:hypothetical protein